MNLQAHKLDLIGALLEVNDAKVLARIEKFIKAETRREQIVPMTMEEYRAEIELALEDYRAGRYTTHEELKKEMESW